MTKLIVEAEGRRREFRLGHGRLTVGSGEGAGLRLESPDLAETHLDLTVADDSVRVEPRPGVVPPKVSGLPRAEAFELRPGHVVSVGRLRFWIEAEGAPTGPVAVQRGRTRSGVRRRSTRKSLPTGLVVTLALAGVAVVGLVVKRAFESQARQGTAPAWATLDAVQRHVLEGNLDLGERKLDDLTGRAELSYREERRVRELREEIAAEREGLHRQTWNIAGTKYFERMLERYEETWLAGTPATPRIRLFLLRCREFRERWPDHPRLDWVRRNEERFRGAVDLSAPPTWEDVEWELEYLVGQPTSNYREALALVDEYMARAEDDTLLEAADERERIVAGRGAYFDELMAEAERALERGDAAKAVWNLVHGVVWIADDALADRAARALVRIDDLEAHLRGYARDYPDRLGLLLEHPVVRAYAERVGFTP